MKRKSILFVIIVLLASTIVLYAALSDRAKNLTSMPERKTISEVFQQVSNEEAKAGNYSIKVITKPANTYGFEIRKFDKVIYLQMDNPFSHTPEGFVYSADAFNVGWWVANYIEKEGRFPPHSAFNEILEKELNVKRFLNQE